MKSTFRTLCLILVIGLAGCGTTTYKYKGVSYSSSTEALAAFDRDLDKVLSEIKSGDFKIKGSIKVVIPSHDTIKLHSVRKDPGMSKEGIDYVATGLEKEYMLMAQALKKRNTFESLSIEHASEPEHPDIGQYDYIAWIYSTKTETAQWYIRSQMSKKTPVTIDMSKDPGAPMLMDWIGSIENFARQHQ